MASSNSNKRSHLQDETDLFIESSEQFKEMQKPLKDKYKNDPSSAFVVLKANGSVGMSSLTCSIGTGQLLKKAGLHPATGGNGFQLCSGNMLLEALAACSGVTLSAVATSLSIPIQDAKVEVEGDLDVRGTLGLSKEAPVGFKEIRLKFELETEATDEQLELLKKLTERYCVVAQSISSPIIITFQRQNSKKQKV